MSSPSPTIRVRTWVRASDADVRGGLLGYLSLYYGNLVVDGVTLRRKSDGALGLSWPKRISRSGERHSVVRPADDSTRRGIDREVLGQLLPELETEGHR